MSTTLTDPDRSCTGIPSNRKVRLAFVTSSLSYEGGGIAIAASTLARALSANDFAVSLIGTTDCRASPPALEAVGDASVVLVQYVGPKSFRYSMGMSRAIDKVDAQILHLHGLWQHPSVATSQWRRKTGRPVVVSPHGMLERWALNNRSLKKQLALRLYEHQNLLSASCIHALTEAEADDIRRAGVKTPVAVIPNGIDLPDRSFLERPAKANTGMGRRTLVFLGRLHPKKGLPAAIEAWRRLKERSPEVATGWRFAISGWDDGGHLSTLVEQARLANLGDDDIAFLDPVYGSAKQDLLATADAFILPSVSEGLPMSVLEAWSFGVPVFMTSACNLSEGFSAGAAIEIPLTADGIAAVLAEHLESDRLAALGQQGRQLVEDRFSWGASAAKFTALYHWLVRGGRPPAQVVLA